MSHKSIELSVKLRAMKHYLLLTLAVILALIIIFVIVQFLYIRYNGSPVAVPDIPRDTQTAGSGEKLSYVIMGDSTAISQGSEYKDGFAVASINHLAQNYSVQAINTGISGATTEEIRNDQLQQAAGFKPDVVLLAAGANDTTHLVSSKTTRESVQHIIDELKKANPEVQIVVTASPAMDSVTRFPHGSKQIMGLRTKQVNAVFEQLIKENDLFFAPIAKETREAFIKDPTLTAADNFHPNARGYALWIPVINQALDRVVEHRKELNDSNAR
jgi:lysophospholipase L1-like esterase